MKIRKNSMRILRHMEFYQFIEDIFAVLKSNNLESLKIIDEFNKMEESFCKLLSFTYNNNK